MSNDTKVQGWVVRVCRLDNEDKWYWIDVNGNVNARLSSAFHYEKEVAVQYAKAINEHSKEYKARAFRYETSKRLKAKQLEERKVANSTTNDKLVSEAGESPKEESSTENKTETSNKNEIENGKQRADTVAEGKVLDGELQPDNRVQEDLASM